MPWCEDRERRRKAKIPVSVEFQTKPGLGGELAVRAAGWGITRAPVLGDQAYGDDSKLRVRVHEAQVEYVLSVSPTTTAFEAGTRFEIPPANPARAGRRASPRPTTSTLRSRRSLRACPLRRGRRSPTVIATASRPGRPSRSCA
jgi:SRSO17 transposase